MFNFFPIYFFHAAWAYTVHSCERNFFSNGIIKYYDDSTVAAIADRISLNIASSFDVDFKGDFKYLPTDWKKSETDQFNSFKNGVIYCFQNFPHKIFQSPTCGNGFIETDEECECSSPDECNSLCCDAQSCRRRPCSQQQVTTTERPKIEETIVVNAPPKRWPCDNGQTISESVLCNGIRDCRDGSDETIVHCFGRPCSRNSYRCR